MSGFSNSYNIDYINKLFPVNFYILSGFLYFSDLQVKYHSGINILNSILIDALGLFPGVTENNFTGSFYESILKVNFRNKHYDIVALFDPKL